MLGRFPLPVEVIPMARSYVARELLRLGGHPVYREGVVTDNGNQILDIHGLKIADPVGLEQTINQLAGVVTVGLFARRAADILIVARDAGVLAQIRRDHRDSRGVPRLELLGEPLELVAAPRDEREVPSLPREAAGERLPDAGRGAGHESASLEIGHGTPPGRAPAQGRTT